jgi:hypothetical protein
MDIDRDLREQCADPEGFLGCILLSLPQRTRLFFNVAGQHASLREYTY